MKHFAWISTLLLHALFAGPTLATELDFQPAFVTVEMSNPEAVGQVRIAGMSLNLLKSMAVSADLDPLSREVYQIPLGRIDRQTFQKFKNEFRSQIAFDDTKSYTLTDFLPPLIHLTHGKRFTSKSLTDPRLDAFVSNLNPEEYDKTDMGKIALITNCWQTTLEFLRGESDGLNVYYSPMQLTAQLFTNREYFKSIRPADLRYGDVLYIGSSIRLEQVALHAAVHIGGGLFFEKTGSDDSFLYRIVPLSTIQAQYDGNEFEFLRYTGKPLPKPSDFSIQATDPDLAAQLPESLAKNLSVEIAFGQGLLGYSFTGIQKINYQAIGR